MDLPYLAVSNGKTYFRRRARGVSINQRLPDPKHRHFRRAYRAAERQFDALLDPWTVSRVIHEYELDPRFRQLKQSTQRVKNYHLQLINERFGDLLVSEITRHDIYDIRDEFRAFSGKMDATVSQFCALLNFALDRGIITENVASNMRRHREGHLRAWPENVLEKALAAAKPMMHLAIITALESGQRIGDWIRITHQHVESGLVELKQKKTGTQVYIPVSERWRHAIAAVPRGPDTLLYNRFGRPFVTTNTLQNDIRFLMHKIGEPGWTFHGLRRNCTNRLAERGASIHEISAITGMTLPVVMYYTREINRRNLAVQLSKRL